MIRFAVVSDIHGNLPALEAVAADIARERIDVVINLGDHCSGPLWPKETVQFLRASGWKHITGNHDRLTVASTPEQLGPSDRYALKHLRESELQWLGSLSASISPMEDVLAFHGAPEDDTMYLLETVEHGRVRLSTRNEVQPRLGTARASLMLCGHTHVPRVVAWEQGVIVNPGSVGLQAYDDTQPEPHVVECGSPHARYAIVERHKSEIRAHIVHVPYDFAVAAQQARNNQRPDWEIALKTGYMT